MQLIGCRKDEGKYLLGTLGIYVIKTILDYEVAKFVNSTVIDKIASLIDVICDRDYLPNGADELFVGRAGFLAAILTLRSVCLHFVSLDKRLKIYIQMKNF